jgi:tyrosine-protein kinase Etk/Wzc
MSQENVKAPLDPEFGSSAPHLVDYWRIITRRLWLVLLIFSVTTAAAIWAASHQRTFYETRLTLQVHDPLERSRQLTSSGVRLGTQIFVDPIESEIQVLLSSQIATQVVEALGMRLRPPEGSGLVRSQLVGDVYVSSEAPDGGYGLRYEADGSSAELVGPDGTALGSAPVRSRLEAGIVAFTVLPPPSEIRTYPLEIVPDYAATGEIRGAIVGAPRQNTNLIDIIFRGADPVLAPAILDAAAAALQEFGASKVRQGAARDVEFVEQQLVQAQAKLTASSRAIRDFQESGAFTDLGAQERQIVNRLRAISEELARLELHEDALRNLGVDLRGSGIEGVDLITFLAVLPEGVNPQLRNLVDEIQERKDEVERLLTGEGKTENHPEVRAIRGQIRAREGELESALAQNLLRIGQDIVTQEGLLSEIEAEQGDFPQLRNELEALELERTSDMETVRFLRAQIYRARILAASAEPYVNVVDQASGAFAVRPRGRTNMMLGALLGLVLGIGAAFFMEYLDRTVRTSADVETLLGIPVLGVIPKLRHVREGEPTPVESPLPLLVAMDPMDPAAEAYRNLRMNLMFMSTEDEPLRTLLFSSPGPNEGKSTTALNVGVMLAQQGHRVLMVDADLRRPSIHKALDLLREPGLTNLLVGDADAREAVRLNVLPNLDILPSGPFPPNPSELLSSNAMERVLEEFRGHYSHIIIDSPPALAVTDAALVGRYVDGVILVLRSGETEQRAAERGVDQLGRVGVRVLGAVLNEVSSTTSEESYYLQYYYSSQPRRPQRWSRLRGSLSKARFW